MTPKTCIIANIPTTYYLSPHFAADGDTVLLVHGRGQTGRSFEAMTKLLDSQKTSRIALDLPGFGGTLAPKEARGIEQYSSFVQKFVDKFALRSIHYVGHSFGCRIALWISAHFPQIWQQQLLIGPGGVEQIPSRTQQTVIGVGKKIFSLPGLRKIGDKIRHHIGGVDYNNASGIMKDILVKTVNEDLTPLLARIEIPTTIVWGTQDDQILKRQVDTMQKYIPNCSIKIFEGANHFVHLQYPAEIVELLGFRTL